MQCTLFTATRHSVTAKELERQLGVTYKCAWRMAHKLRELMQMSDDYRPLEGHIEMDETYVGGKVRYAKGKVGGSAGRHKTIVFGMVERQGLVRAGTVKDIKRKTLQEYIDKHVVWGSTVSTDDAGSYAFLGGITFKHGVVNHSKEQWVNGIHHTNTIEGYWSRLKNSIRGTHVHISKKHMNKYLAEFVYRYNHRKESNATIFYRLLFGLV